MRLYLFTDIAFKKCFVFETKVSWRPFSVVALCNIKKREWSMKELKAGNKYWVQYNKMRPFPYFACCSKTIGHKKIDFFFPISCCFTASVVFNDQKINWVLNKSIEYFHIKLLRCFAHFRPILHFYFSWKHKKLLVFWRRQGL